jgi:RNA polymerase sigma-70 factor (ECF subfamily)
VTETLEQRGDGIAVGRYTHAVVIEFDRIFGRGTVTGESEEAPLRRFIADGDESALTALVVRHAPMVLGVCRRVLRDEHDVEDAFQATFLVLVRRAAAIRDGERIGA